MFINNAKDYEQWFFFTEKHIIVKEVFYGKVSSTSLRVR